MTPITLRVLDGADRGRTFEQLTAPITIGREEGNTIQLNDERVSRYHVKIQEDHSKLVLTDLESTNGTKVNGEDIQLRILRYGDMISVGRSVLLFGTREEIARRMAQLRDEDPGSDGSLAPEDLKRAEQGAPFNFGLHPDAEDQEGLQTLDPPELPDRLSPAQAAQLAELMEYLHIRIRHLLDSVRSEDKLDDRVTLEALQWQHLLDLQSRLAEYLRKIGDPESSEF